MRNGASEPRPKSERSVWSRERRLAPLLDRWKTPHWRVTRWWTLADDANSSKRALPEVRVDSRSDRGPLSVAKYVNEIQIGGNHWFKIVSEDHFFDNTTPVGECFDSPGETDALLVHAEALLAEFDAMSVNQMLGITRA